MIQFERVSKYYDDICALHNVSFSVDKGEFAFLVGPSGAGKSTVMQLLYREEQVTEGRVRVDNESISSLPPRKVPFLRRKLGMIFQDYRLLEHKTVAENISMPLIVKGERVPVIRERLRASLEWVGLWDRREALPPELSGGEQQRVAVARAVIHDPLVILADEPTGNLDPETGWQIVSLLQDLNRRGCTVLMATHDKPVVDAMRKRVITLDNGRIVNDQSRGLYAHEA